jgi:RNA polymerase sigma-70 factor (ECF subfamily)
VLPSPPQLDADLALMNAVSAGDPRAQRELIERLLKRVRRITGLLCGSAADADDAAQLAIVEILQSASTFRFATSLERWAERITIRCTLRLIRRERARQRLLTRWLVPGFLPWSVGPDNQRGEGIRLDDVFARLSTEQRESFVLHHALGYSVTEIAELTATAPGTIKSRLVTSRKLLRRLLELEARRHGTGGAR